MEGKEQIFKSVATLLAEANFTIVDKDESRPWGGFYVIDEAQAPQFAKHFFPGENLDEIKITNKLSPKILIVAPHKRLSWQYHRRRAEIWKCISDKVSVATSDTDEHTHTYVLNNGDIIKLGTGKRHRLIGMDQWGIVAEIWQHTDESNPSDEDDIIRLQDDYNRK
jgi:mannose-6-phosphate isomerase-like protein (cupin superfamily)